MDWMAQKCIQWWRFVNMVMNSRVSEMVPNFKNTKNTVSFKTRTETTLIQSCNWYLKQRSRLSSCNASDLRLRSKQ
jgi:hypothetical protein